jgi:putative oxidoreductase
MNLPAILYPKNPPPDSRSSIGLLIARVAAGLVVAPHGFYKAMGGAAGLAAGLAKGGMPAPTLLAWCATLAELVGGLLMVVGLATRFAAASVAFTLTVAWMLIHSGDIAKIGAQGGAAFEYPFLLSMVAIAIAVAGPGMYSIDAKLFGKRD